MNVKIVSEKTLLPISLIISIIGATLWIGELSSDSKAQAKDINRLDNIYTNTITSIDRRLSNIEGRLGVQDGSKK